MSLLPYLALIAANLTLATVPILVRLAQAEHMPSMSIATLRLAVAVVLLAPYIYTRHRAEIRTVTRQDAGLIVIAGLSTTLFFVFYFTSLEHTSVLIASVFSGTHPLWVAFMEIAVLRTVLRRSIWVGLALVLGGSALFALSGNGANVTLGDNPALGSVLSLIAAFGSAVYFIVGRSVRRRVSALAFLWLMLIVALLTCLAVTAASGAALTGYSPQSYLWIVLMALGAQIVGQASISYALAHLSPTLISITTQVSIILSAGLALLIFQEYPQPLQLVASAVIVVGVTLVVVQPKPSSRTAPV